MSRITIALGAALAASLTGNVLQLIGRTASKRPPQDAVAGGGNVGAPADATPGPRPAPSGAAPLGPAAAGALPARCPDQLAALEARLVEAEQQVEARLTTHERFAPAAPSAASSARVRPFLERAFADAPDSVAWDVACRGDACRLEVVEPEAGTDFDWSQRVQAEDVLSDLFGSMSFSSPVPGQDPVSKERS